MYCPTAAGRHGFLSHRRGSGRPRPTGPGPPVQERAPRSAAPGRAPPARYTTTRCSPGSTTGTLAAMKRVLRRRRKPRDS